MISLIVAVAENGVIGFQGGMPWHYPEDLRYFKSRTVGHTLIMGGTTCRGLGKPLPGRTTIMLTRGAALPGYVAAADLPSALALAHQTDPDPIIAGGAQVYQQALPRCQRAWITVVPGSPQGDAHFCGLEPGAWRLDQETISEAGLRYQTWLRGA